MISMAFVLTACAGPPAQQQDGRDAEERASEWLALMDAGDAGGSWEIASTLFQAATTKEQWKARVKSVQAMLGEPMGRQFVAAKYAARVPWLTEGEYVLVQYRIKFGGRPHVETLWMRRDADEQWRTLNYLIRPE